MWSLCAELQKGVSQQCLVMANMVLLAKSCTVVSAPHSSAFTQPKVLMSRSPAETQQLDAIQCSFCLLKAVKINVLPDHRPQSSHLPSPGLWSSAPPDCRWSWLCSRRPKSPGHIGNTSSSRVCFHSLPSPWAVFLLPHLSLTKEYTTDFYYLLLLMT